MRLIQNWPSYFYNYCLTGLGDLSSFASLAANLQNNPEAFNTLSNIDRKSVV